MLRPHLKERLSSSPRGKAVNVFWARPICEVTSIRQTMDAFWSHMQSPGQALWGVRKTYCARVGRHHRSRQNRLTTHTNSASYCNSWQTRIPTQDELITGWEALSYYRAITWNLFALSQNLLPFNFQLPKHLVLPRTAHPSAAQLLPMEMPTLLPAGGRALCGPTGHEPELLIQRRALKHVRKQASVSSPADYHLSSSAD